MISDGIIYKDRAIMINKTNRHDHRIEFYSIKIMIYNVNKNIFLFHICVTMAFHFQPIERLNKC